MSSTQVPPQGAEPARAVEAEPIARKPLSAVQTLLWTVGVLAGFALLFGFLWLVSPSPGS
jgi:hypothetical protein